MSSFNDIKQYHQFMVTLRLLSCIQLLILHSDEFQSLLLLDFNLWDRLLLLKGKDWS